MQTLFKQQQKRATVNGGLQITYFVADEDLKSFLAVRFWRQILELPAIHPQLQISEQTINRPIIWVHNTNRPNEIVIQCSPNTKYKTESLDSGGGEKSDCSY